MVDKQIRLRCADMMSKAALKAGLAIMETGKFIKRAEAVYGHVIKGKDIELRLKCAEIAISNSAKRALMSDILFKTIDQIEEFVSQADKPETKGEDKPKATVPGSMNTASASSK